MIRLDDQWTVGVLAVLFLYLIYWYKRPKNFPPGPRGIPLLGYVPAFKKPHLTTFELSKKLGPILCIRIGSEEAVFLNDFESINEAFVKQGAAFSGRPRFASLESVRKGRGIAFVDSSNLWKSQRKFGLMTLRGFGVGKKGIEKICLEELNYLNKEIEKANSNTFNISVSLHNAVANVICSITLGDRFDYDDEHFIKMLYVIIHMFEDPFLSLCHRLVVLSPLLKHVPPISLGINRLVKTTEELVAWMGELVKEHEETYDENSLRDFIDAFIAEKKKGTDPSYTIEQLVIYVYELFMAGSETSASYLYWMLLCVLHFPNAQKKMWEEILETFGSNGEISYSKKANMPYTNAFIQEVYRVCTLTPIGIPHKTTQDTELGGYLIPKNTKVISNMWAVHNDPNLWKEPEKFMPERFLDEKGNFISSKHVIPFSIGPRHCLGEQLARMEIFLFLAGMLQRFEFSPDPDHDLSPITDGRLGMIYSPKSYKMIAKPR